MKKPMIFFWKPFVLTLFGRILEVMSKHQGDIFMSFNILQEPMLVQKQYLIWKPQYSAFWSQKDMCVAIAWHYHEGATPTFHKKFYDHEGDKSNPRAKQG